MKRLSAISAGLLVIALTLFGCTHQPYDPSWITLIDGEKGLENFIPLGDANWRAEDGAIVADKGGKIISKLVSKDSFKDFQLRAEFWVTAETNSGIYFRCTNLKNPGCESAYEANIWDTSPRENYGTGAINGVAAVVPMPKAGGKWNVYEITAKGSNLIVVLNGERTVDVNDSKFASGPIALQYGHGVVKFRKLQIKHL